MPNPIREDDFTLSEDDLEPDYRPVSEQVGQMLGNVGRRFMTSDGRTIFDICRMVAVTTRREYSHCGTVFRYTFSDGSALVVGPESWDYAGHHDAREEEHRLKSALRKINDFVDTHGRPPEVTRDAPCELMLAHSLKGLRADPSIVEQLANVDRHKLLS